MKCPDCGSNKILFVREEIVNAYYTVIDEEILWGNRYQEETSETIDIGYECKVCRKIFDNNELLTE